MTRPILYVCAPFATATADEVYTRDCAIRAAAERGWTPVYAPYLFAPVYTDETEAVRALCFDMNLALLVKSDAILVVGSRVTEGMSVEIDWWTTHRYPKVTGHGRGLYEWPRLPDAATKERRYPHGRIECCPNGCPVTDADRTTPGGRDVCGTCGEIV